MTNEFDLIEHPMVQNWLKELAKTEALALIGLVEGNAQRFRRLFSEPSGKTQRFEYWKRDYLGITIFLYTDNRSTYYKIQYLGEKDLFCKDKKMGSYMASFLGKLAKELASA